MEIQTDLTIILLLGIILVAYIGPILALLYAKKDYKDALVPGTIAWIVVLVITFFVALEALFALLASAIIGILVLLALLKVE